MKMKKIQQTTITLVCGGFYGMKLVFSKIRRKCHYVTVIYWLIWLLDDARELEFYFGRLVSFLSSFLFVQMNELNLFWNNKRDHVCREFGNWLNHGVCINSKHKLPYYSMNP